MSSQETQRFLQTVVQNHSLATGIKTLCNHSQIVEFASQQGFNLSLSEWLRYVLMDQLQLQDSELERIYTTNCQNWSWAFRQVSIWRNLLMEGADIEPHTNSRSTATKEFDPIQIRAQHSEIKESDNNNMDLILEEFIKLSRENSHIQDQIKAAKNESEILEIVRAHGFLIDSITLLRRWSKHTDFSKPTWMGWFD